MYSASSRQGEMRTYLDLLDWPQSVRPRTCAPAPAAANKAETKTTTLSSVASTSPSVQLRYPRDGRGSIAGVLAGCRVAIGRATTRISQAILIVLGERHRGAPRPIASSGTCHHSNRLRTICCYSRSLDI